MYKLCKSEQAARRQRELEKGLLQVMSTTPFAEISVSDLCQQLGIPRKSFYRYFSCKDGALQALIDHTLTEYEEFRSGRYCAERNLLWDLETYFLFWQEKKPLLDVLAKNGISGMLFERSLQYAAAESVVPSRLLSSDLQRIRRHATSFAVSGLLTMMLDWYRGGYQETPAQLAAIAAQLITRPLFPNMDELL